ISNEFNSTIYKDLFYKWLVANKDNYLKDDIKMEYVEPYKRYLALSFQMDKIYGQITIWNNNIVEEEIHQREDKKLLFYLHYTIIDLAQCIDMFNEFYDNMLKHSKIKDSYIALVCTNGLSTSVFASEIAEICELENIHLKVISMSLDRLYEHYQEYDAIYLAPQIAYQQAQIIGYTHREKPVYCVDTTLFATKDYRSILKIMRENLTKQKK
ncbi:MAG: hypothetical protein LUH02_11175, partial [Erysipelotrichaceae bacterium]|nr:hypothetical protein [Erysipelotrichaceae bacterium]